LTRIESEAFYESSLESIMIPNNVEILGPQCFSHCKSLSSITFESSSHLTRIESEAFSYSSLHSIMIPSSVEILGSSWFLYCESLSSITFELNSRLTRSVGLKVIPAKGFSWSGLTSIVIPATILIVERQAFSDCYSLTELLWAEGSQVKVIEEEAFERTQLKQLIIPASLHYIGARMCLATTELLLPRGAQMRMFEEWRASFALNRNKVMGRRTFRELKDEGNGGAQRTRAKMKDGGECRTRPTGAGMKDGESGGTPRTRDKMKDGGEGRTRPTGDEMKDGGESEVQRTRCCALL
jgi:hypothetical protein